MKPSLLTLLCLLPYVLMGAVNYWFHRKECQREEVYEFWSKQCRISLAHMKEAQTEEEYEQWNATMRVNMRRYEQEVLGR